MPGTQRAFLKAVAKRWREVFPFLKPVHLAEVPQLQKGTNLVCDRYFAERGRAYFIVFYFSQKRHGEFSLGVTVSDSLTQSVMEHGFGPPSPTALGMYSIGPFIGVQTRRWALIDHQAEHKEFSRSLGVEPLDLGERIPNTYFAPSYAAPREEIFDFVIEDVNRVLRQHVFPKLQIEFEPPRAGLSTG